jgi:2-dehydropantoate 2-reductase
MGSLFGGLLAAAGEDVTLLTRNAAHVDAIQNRGLRIVDEQSDSNADRIVPVRATTDPETVGVVDLVLVFVKSYATADAMVDAEPLLGPETDVLTLQNGLDNAETIAEHVTDRRILVGVTTHGAIQDAPGTVHHTGTGDTALGRWQGDAAGEDSATDIAGALTAAGIPTEVVADPETLVWEKVLVNVGINAPTALARVDNGALVETESGRALLRSAVTEAEQVARAHGHDVREDVVAYAITVAEQTASNRSSMRVDLESGHPTEVESLYGAVLDRAEDVGLDAPVVRTLADLIRLAERDR